MALAAVIVILIVWAIIGIYEHFKNPKLPPIDDMQEHLKTIQQLPDKRARQKYLRDLTKKK